MPGDSNYSWERRSWFMHQLCVNFIFFFFGKVNHFSLDSHHRLRNSLSSFESHLQLTPAFYTFLWTFLWPQCKTLQEANLFLETACVGGTWCPDRGIEATLDSRVLPGLWLHRARPAVSGVLPVCGGFLNTDLFREANKLPRANVFITCAHGAFL